MVSVFQENRVRIHVKFAFAWKTVRLFPMQTKRKHNKIILSVFTQKWKTGFLFWIQTDGILLLCFLFVCVGNSLHVFQANTNFTCILTLFYWNTGTIPSSEKGGTQKNSEMWAEMKPHPDSLGAQLRACIISIKGNCTQALNDDPSWWWINQWL